MSTHPTRRAPAAALALVLAAGLAAGCSKDDGAGPEATTTTTVSANEQQQALEATERVLATVRLPGAVGMFAKSTKDCPTGQFPQVVRTDTSSLPPDQVVEELTDLLEADGWTAEHLADGRETYAKAPFQVWIETIAADGGGTTATVEVRTSDLTCP